MKLDSIKFPKQKSVRGGWFLSYILVLIVPLLLCLLLYNYSAGIITAESKRIYGSALDQARIDLDSYLTEIEQTLSHTSPHDPASFWARKDLCRSTRQRHPWTIPQQ